MKKIFISLFIVLATIPLQAQTKLTVNDDGAIETYKEPFKQYSQLSVSFSYRTDELRNLDQSITGHITYYNFVKPFLALKMGIGVDFGTEANKDFYNRQKVSELMYESGLRFQDPSLTAAPYAEIGVDIHHYNVQELSDVTKVGLGMALGVELNLHKAYKLDLSLQQTINHHREYTVVYTPPLPGDIIYTPQLNSKFYNPTSIRVGMNFKL